MNKKKTQRLNGAQKPPLQFSGDPVAWAAWLYYVDGENQEGAAKRLGVSRATVMNYLNEAKERNLVRISLDPAMLSEGALNAALCQRYGLKDVLVLPGSGGVSLDPETLRKQAGSCGARALKSLLAENQTLGVAWGRTMLEVGLALPRDAVQDVTVLQIAGSMLNDEKSSPEFCSAMIANRLGAKSLNFHAPAIVSSFELRESLMQEPALAKYRERLKHCDMMIFGVGGVEEAPSLGDEHFSDPGIVKAYSEQGAEGIIVGRFINADGHEISGPLTNRQIAISLEDLKNTPTRLLVAAGQSKAKAIRAALMGGYCTHLIMDFETAQTLLD